MSKTKTAEEGTSVKTVTVKVRKVSSKEAKALKVSSKAKQDLVSQRAAAVEENLGETQSLRDFLSGVGWR